MKINEQKFNEIEKHFKELVELLKGVGQESVAVILIALEKVFKQNIN